MSEDITKFRIYVSKNATLLLLLTAVEPLCVDISYLWLYLSQFSMLDPVFDGNMTGLNLSVG